MKGYKSLISLMVAIVGLALAQSTRLQAGQSTLYIAVGSALEQESLVTSYTPNYGGVVALDARDSTNDILLWNLPLFVDLKRLGEDRGFRTDLTTGNGNGVAGTQTLSGQQPWVAGNVWFQFIPAPFVVKAGSSTNLFLECLQVGDVFAHGGTFRWATPTSTVGFIATNRNGGSVQVVVVPSTSGTVSVVTDLTPYTYQNQSGTKTIFTPSGSSYYNVIGGKDYIVQVLNFLSGTWYEVGRARADAVVDGSGHPIGGYFQIEVGNKTIGGQPTRLVPSAAWPW